MSRPISPPPSKRRKLQSATSRASTEEHQQHATSQLGPGRVRIFSWNVNGIAPFLQSTITSFFGRKQASSTGSEPCLLRDVLRRYDFPTMLLLQEIKLSPGDTASRRAIERAINPRSDESALAPSYSAYFCFPKDKYNATGFGRKIYGVCSIIREDFIAYYDAKVHEVEWDSEGRFLVCETEGRGSTPALAVINCYMVNGTEAPYKSDTGQIQGTRHDRKIQVHSLLHDECRKLEANDTAVILAGDMNVARARLDGHPNLRTNPIKHCINRADFETKFFSASDEGLNMVDSFRELHPQTAGYTYYPRLTSFGASCDRIDLIMLSRSLGPHLIRAGIMETSTDRGPSDHVPLYTELHFGSSDETDKPTEGA
ncbi:putative AP endonuclease 1, endonuclease/exonuclease/phosphatase [Septoria linicola]|nr:putative AP endonuclease 1, endonuclease/exonuclease/phosphatase [Septoria linicola]